VKGDYPYSTHSHKGWERPRRNYIAGDQALK
jgi:hypothetical protein